MPASKELIEQLLADPKQAVCPQCSGTGFWDNRETAKGKQPVFKCKNKDCDTGKGYPFGVFAQDIKKVAPEAAAPAAKNGVKHPPTWGQVRYRFAEAIVLALKGAEQIGKTGVPMVGENITTMVNTLMMTSERTGCWPELGKKKHAPVANVPAKAVAPKKDENPHENIDPDDEYTEEDDLPF